MFEIRSTRNWCCNIKSTRSKLIDWNLVQINFFDNVGPWSWKTKYFVNDTNGLKTSRKILIVYISDILSSISYVKRKLSATRTTKMAKYIILIYYIYLLRNKKWKLMWLWVLVYIRWAKQLWCILCFKFIRNAV